MNGCELLESLKEGATRAQQDALDRAIRLMRAVARAESVILLYPDRAVIIQTAQPNRTVHWYREMPDVPRPPRGNLYRLLDAPHYTLTYHYPSSMRIHYRGGTTDVRTDS